MKSKILILILALCVVAGASAKSRGVKFRSLDVKEFARYIERGDVVLVDVRTPEEFSAGHITGVDRNLDVRSATFFKDYQSLPKDKRILFLMRYWYMDSIEDIAKAGGISQSKVKMTLLRLRRDLKAFLEKEGIEV